MSENYMYHDNIRYHLPRDILNDDDIRKILKFPQYAEDADVPPSHFWIIQIVLFSGARLAEICRLEVDDFSVEEGIQCFDIHTEENRKGKFSWADRLVPIHPFLLNDLNMMGFVSGMKNSGETRLFPDLDPDSRGWYGNSISKMFGRLATEYGIISKGGCRKGFSSIRYTVITKLKLLKVSDSLLSQLVGYKDPRVDMQPPWDLPKPYTLRHVYEVVTKISYDVDFSPIRNSHFLV